tara:strand:+ start:1971 stop:2456 length:486 start_codon:yes stop_codon:yes gene_type:complete
MTTLNYILDLFKVASNQLGCPYVKSTPERLHTWSIDNNHNTFIALLNDDESTTVIPNQANSKSYDLNFVVCVETTKLDPTNNDSFEKIEEYEIQVNELAERFIQLLEQNDKVTLNDYTLNKAIQRENFLGIGKVLDLTLTISDTNLLCDIFKNEQTKNIGC